MTTAYGLYTKFPTNNQKPGPGARLAQSHTINKGLMGLWPMFEGAGQLVTEVTGNNSPGVMSSSATWCPSNFGKAIDLASTGLGGVNCGNGSALNITGSMTMSCWAYATVAATNGVYGRFMSKLHSQGGFQGFELLRAANDAGSGITHGGVYFQTAINGSLAAVYDTIAMPIGVWTHYTAIYNAPLGTAYVYRNGQLANSAFIGGNAIGTNTLNYYIGNTSSFPGMEGGKLDLVAQWNRALNVQEVYELYLNPFVFFETTVASRMLFVFGTSSTYDESVTVNGAAASTLLDGGTLYRTQSVDGISAATLASQLTAVNTITVGAFGAITLAIPTLLVLTISGTSAVTLLPGQQYFDFAAVQGLSNLAITPGIGYFDTVMVDATADVAMSQIGLKLLTLSVDGIAATTIDTLQNGRISLTIDGVAALTLTANFSYVLIFSISGISAIYEGSSLNTGGTDGLYNFLYLATSDTAVVSLLRTTPGNQNPSSQGDVTVDCQAVLNRTVSQTLAMAQVVALKKPTEILDTFHVVSQVVDVTRVRIRTAINTITFTQDAQAYRAFTQTLVFAGTATVTRVMSRTVSQTLGLSQVLTRKTVLSRATTQTLVMGQNRLVRTPIIGTVNTSNPTGFEYYQPVAQAILVPQRCLVILGVPAQTVILPCPQFGDSQAREDTLNLKRTMTGDTYTYVRKTELQKLKYTFQLGTFKATELKQFLVDHCHEVITLVNHKGETWYVNLSNNPFEFAAMERWQPKGERHDITLEFEGVKL